MEEIEVEVVDAALLQLLFKYLLDLRHVRKVVAGELVREIVALARVLAQCLAYSELSAAVVVGVGGVEVVHAVLICVVYDALSFGIVNLAVIAVDDGQAHIAHAQPAELQTFEISVYHAVASQIGVETIIQHAFVGCKYL